MEDRGRVKRDAGWVAVVHGVGWCGREKAIMGDGQTGGCGGGFLSVAGYAFFGGGAKGKFQTVGDRRYRA